MTPAERTLLRQARRSLVLMNSIHLFAAIKKEGSQILEVAIQDLQAAIKDVESELLAASTTSAESQLA